MLSKLQAISEITSTLEGVCNINSIAFSQLVFKTEYNKYDVENHKQVVSYYRGVYFWFSCTDMENIARGVLSTHKDIFVQLKGTNYLFKITY